MPTRINDATPIAMLTVGQLEELTRSWVRGELASIQAGASQTTGKRHVYGLKGLAQLLGCSKTKACQINTSGVIDAALVKLGNLLIYDADLVLELLQQHNDGRKA